MGYEREVLIRARNRHKEAVEQYRKEQQQRLLEIYHAVPELERLDNQLRQTMAEVMVQALRHGEDPKEALAAIREKNQGLQRRREELLEQTGHSASAVQEGPMCRKCSDTGYVGEKMCSCLERYCQEEQRKELTSLLSQNASFDDFSLDYYPTAVNPSTGISPRAQMELVYEACVNYASHFDPKRSKNLLLSGAPGLGKTFLSACIAQEVVARGYSVVYDTAIHVFSCLEKQKFGGGTEEELRMAERIMECDLLILDDLGTEMPTSFIAPALYSVVNGRILTHKPSIISTNFNIEQLGARYTPQITSRIAGEYHILSFAGQDIRRLKSRQ